MRLPSELYDRRRDQLSPLPPTHPEDAPFRAHRSPVSPLFSASPCARLLSSLPVTPLPATLTKCKFVSPFPATHPENRGVPLPLSTPSHHSTQRTVGGRAST